jgi:RNA recognition motif-containing protein
VSRGFSQGKRQREAERARKQREKSERRAEKRERGASRIPVTTAEAITGELPTSDEALRAMHERETGSRAAAQIPGRLFVGGLGRETDDASLRAAFEAYGEVTDATVVRDRDTGDSRGFGFVTMASRKDAARAMEGLDDHELDGHPIRIDVATDRR